MTPEIRNIGTPPRKPEASNAADAQIRTRSGFGARRQGPHVAAAFGKAGGIPLVDDREAEQKCDDGQHERPERQRNHRVRPGERESEHRPERHGDGMAQAVVADPSPRRDVGSTSDAHVVAAVLTDA